MAMILTPILISQNTIMFSVDYFKGRLQRIMLAKNYLIFAHKNALQDKTTGPRTIENPATTLSYKKEKTSGTIAKQYKDTYRETVLIEWTKDNNKKQDTLISFIFKPAKKTEQKS
jgi:hypothetical protein